MSESLDTVAKLRAGRPVTGTMLRIARNPAVAVLARNAGFDFAMLDMEHGAYGFDTVADFSLVARPLGFGLMVRVPELSRNFISRALDCGAIGVMVPMLETVEQAEALVKWARYPEVGSSAGGGRGLSSSGGHTGYSRPGLVPAFIAEQNQATLTIAQIETVTGIKNAKDIAQVPGLDALLMGPNDLAVSLGRPGETMCDEVAEAIAEAAKATHAAGKIFGMHAGTPLLKRYAANGMTLFMNELDDNILLEGFKSINAATRGVIEEHHTS